MSEIGRSARQHQLRAVKREGLVMAIRADAAHERAQALLRAVSVDTRLAHLAGDEVSRQNVPAYTARVDDERGVQGRWCRRHHSSLPLRERILHL